MKRVIICILTVTLLIGALAVPSYAADFDNDFEFQVLDFGFPNGGNSNLVSLTGSGTASWTLPVNVNVYYVDVLFNFSGNLTSVTLRGNNNTNTNPLNFAKVSGNLYRAWGHMSSNFYKTLQLDFTASNTSTSFVIFHSFKAYSQGTVTNNIRLEGSGFYTDGEFDLSINWGDSRPTYIFFQPTGEWYENLFVADFFCEDWRLYDFVDIHVSLTVSGLNTISASFNDQTVPFTVTEVVSDAGLLSLYFLTIRLDLRGLDRSASGNPYIRVTGSASSDYLNAISLHDATGFVEIEFDTLSYFFNNLFSKLKGHFDNLSTLISGFRSDVNTVVTTWSDIINKSIGSIGTNIVNAVNSFKTSITSTVTSWSDTINKSVGSVGSKIDNWGQKIYDAVVGQKSDDTTVSDAIENQEQVNQEVNSQLQSAVGSWSDNVGEVTQGFNLALTNATPALIWISGMAQNVFSGMGWFGNIFFFLGFLHVFFLLMSKSGLGRAIDRADKRGDD